MKESTTTQRPSSSEFRAMRKGSSREGQTGALIVLPPAELQEARKLQAGRSGNVAGTVARFEIYGTQGDTVDQNSSAMKLLGLALDAQNQPVVNALILFDVGVDNQTGSAFYIKGDPTPRAETFAITGEYGYFMAEDALVTGTTPGALRIHVAPADDPEGAVSATYEREVSARTPVTMERVSGGGETFPVGSVVTVDAAALLRNDEGAPIEYGQLHFAVYDPNDTGTLLLYGSLVASWIAVPLDDDGMAVLAEVLKIGDRNPGASFYIRASRYGKEPFFDFEYSTV